METLSIDIINPKANALLRDLAKLDFIRIRKSDKISESANEKIKELTIDELNRIIDRAEDDSKNNQLFCSQELKKEIELWT